MKRLRKAISFLIGFKERSTRMVSEVVASLPSHAWKRLAVIEGEKGPIEYHWARTTAASPPLYRGKVARDASH